jgi:hypothetical protein
MDIRAETHVIQHKQNKERVNKQMVKLLYCTQATSTTEMFPFAVTESIL